MALLGKSVKDMLFAQHDWIRGYDMLLALEIRRNNPEIITLIREAMEGDNQKVLLSSTIIRAIVISGNEEMLELLLKLLVAARLQEGLRQQILEQADAGSMATLKRILKVCLEQDMFRYSSAIRALDTWTGLGFGDARPALVRKCAQLAYECLADASKRKEYLSSADTLESYFAIWGSGCKEILDSGKLAKELIESPAKYRRVLGWVYISHADSPAFQMIMAQHYLQEKDPELLAWVISNLAVTRELMSYLAYGKHKDELVPIENAALPDDHDTRRKLFYQLKEVAEYIGNKERIFRGNPFSFSVVTLSRARVLECMMSLAGFDMDEELIDELKVFAPELSVDERCAFYMRFLDVQHNRKQKGYLREALQDRSVQIREYAVVRLSKSELDQEDLQALGNSLRSKRSALRKSVLTILKEQSPLKLTTMITDCLSSKEEYQIQAGLELLITLKEDHPMLYEDQKTLVTALQSKTISTQTEILLKKLLENEEEIPVYHQENGFGMYLESDLAKVHESLRKRAEKIPLFSEKKLAQILFLSKEEVLKVFQQMNAVYTLHADYEYEVMTYDGGRTKILFGDDGRNSVGIPAEFGSFQEVNRNRKLEMIPFYQEFVESIGEYGQDMEKILALCNITGVVSNSNNETFGEYQPWVKDYTDRFGVQYHNVLYTAYGVRYWKMRDILQLMLQKMDSRELSKMALQIYCSLVKIIGTEDLFRNCMQAKEGRGI